MYSQKGCFGIKRAQPLRLAPKGDTCDYCDQVSNSASLTITEVSAGPGFQVTLTAVTFGTTLVKRSAAVSTVALLSMKLAPVVLTAIPAMVSVPAVASLAVTGPRRNGLNFNGSGAASISVRRVAIMSPLVARMPRT